MITNNITHKGVGGRRPVVQLTESSDQLDLYIQQKFGDGAALGNIHKNFILKSSSSYKVYSTTLGEGIIMKIVSDTHPSKRHRFITT